MNRVVWAIALAGFLLASPLSRAADKKKIVFVAGPPSHGFAQHEHNAGCRLLAKCLNEAMGDQIETVVYQNGWPKDAHAFDGAAAIIMYCDGGNGHMVLSHLKQVDELASKGVGIGAIHYGVEPGDRPQNNGREEFLRWIGGYFETFYSVNPVWQAHFDSIPSLDVTRGVHPFTTHDEWYYHMRFRDGMKGVKIVLGAIPPDSTRRGKDDAHGGNPAVRADIGKNVSEGVVWISENDNGQRGFGCSGGHYHFNWAQNDFRKTILNCIVWIAHVDVPAEGVVTKTPTIDDLLQNQDDKIPANFNKEKEQQQIDKMNAPYTPGQTPAAAH